MVDATDDEPDEMDLGDCTLMSIITSLTTNFQ